MNFKRKPMDSIDVFASMLQMFSDKHKNFINHTHFSVTFRKRTCHAQS